MTTLESLRGSARFHSVRRDGCRTSLPGVSVAVARGRQGVRLGLAVRVAGAVERNRVKRRLRAALREALARNDIAGDIVVKADTRGAAVPFQELVDLFERSFDRGAA